MSNFYPFFNNFWRFVHIASQCSAIFQNFLVTFDHLSAFFFFLQISAYFFSTIFDYVNFWNLSTLFARRNGLYGDSSSYRTRICYWILLCNNQVGSSIFKIVLHLSQLKYKKRTKRDENRASGIQTGILRHITTKKIFTKKFYSEKHTRKIGFSSFPRHSSTFKILCKYYFVHTTWRLDKQNEIFFRI